MSSIVEVNVLSVELSNKSTTVLLIIEVNGLPVVLAKEFVVSTTVVSVVISLSIAVVFFEVASLVIDIEVVAMTTWLVVVLKLFAIGDVIALSVVTNGTDVEDKDAELVIGELFVVVRETMLPFAEVVTIDVTAGVVTLRKVVKAGELVVNDSVLVGLFETCVFGASVKLAPIDEEASVE